MSEHFIAVDLGGTRLRTAVGGRAGPLRGRRDEATLVATGPEGVVDQIERMARESLAESGVDIGRVANLTIAAPGPLNGATGVVYAPPNLPGWNGFPLKDRLQDRLGIKVKVVNDANAAALGEFYFGSGKGCNNLVYITVSTGIGGGVVLDGKLREGSSGTAGEIGHTTIDRHGPVCKCGNIGCLEMIASGTSIARRFREALDAGERSAVTEGLEGEPTAADVAAGAQAGDPLATAIFIDAAEAVGFGVINCIHLFNPDVVAIGGGVTRSGALFFDAVNRIVNAHALAVPRAAARVVATKLGDDVGLIGAAAVAESAEETGG